MYDIITFGSAAKDIFLKAKGFKILEGDFVTGKGMCFGFGSKVDIDEIIFASGGGGTNTAATFANQGMKVAFCGAIGNDLAGKEIIEELKTLKIDTRFIKKSDKPTNHSVVFMGKEKTILVYRGAADTLSIRDIPWNKLKTKWIYIAPLSGELCKVFPELIDFAKKKGIKVALNPGMSQLSLPDFAKYVANVDILTLNREEASFLTKLPYTNEQDIFRKIDEICSGIAIMTKGGEGVTVSDGKHLYSAPSIEDKKMVDATGAGDAFGSGFVAEYIKSADIVKAIQFAMGNSAACVEAVGAKPGLLKKGQEFIKVDVKKEECVINGGCICKSC